MKEIAASALAIVLLIITAPNGTAQVPQSVPPVIGQGSSPPPPALPPSPPPLPASVPQPVPEYRRTPGYPSVAGTVKQYLLTPVGDVEGVELEDGTDVRFPPHMGAALTAIVKPGDRASVMGFVAPPTSYGRAVKAVTITNLATNQSVVDQPPAVPPLPPWLRGASMHEMTLNGTLDHALYPKRSRRH